MVDGLTFEDSVQLAIRTTRQTPHSRLKMTPFQMHLGRRPRTALSNLIDKPECLLSNWKKTLTNYISAQPTELQVVTINDSEGEMADYLVLDETRKRSRSVSRDFKNYQFYEKENKPNSIKCGFKTNKILTAVAETDHTINTSEGRVINKKLASRPLKFQTSKKPEEPRKATNRYRRCGKFSSGELCETHLRIRAARQDNNNNEPSTSYTLPTMPTTSKKRAYSRIITYDSSSQDSEPNSNHADKDSSDEEEEFPNDTVLQTEIGREIDRIRSQTPLPASPIECSTEIATEVTQPDTSGTPIHGQNTTDTAEVDSDNAGKVELKPRIRTENSQSNSNLEPRRSKRIKTAQRVVKLGGVDYF